MKPILSMVSKIPARKLHSTIGPDRDRLGADRPCVSRTRVT